VLQSQAEEYVAVGSAAPVMGAVFSLAS